MRASRVQAFWRSQNPASDGIHFRRTKIEWGVPIRLQPGGARMIMYLTGVSNIRDVLPYPRTVGNAEF